MKTGKKLSYVVITCGILLIIGLSFFYPKHLLDQATEAAMIETARELTEAVKSGKILEYQMQEYKGVSPEVETGSTTYNVLGHFQVVLRDDGGKERRMDVCRFYLMERVNTTSSGRKWVDKLEGDEQIYIRTSGRLNRID